MTRSRFWLFYIAAWFPYALSYFVLFRLLPGHLEALRQTAYNILPAVALGVLILPWTRVLSWRLHARWWFYPAQLGSAVAYSLFWYFGVLIAGSAGQALVTHHLRLGYFSYYALQWQFFSGLMIYGNIAGILYVSQVNQRLRQEKRRREQAESLRTTAELSALRAQLNPHFLFNTLNSIMALAGPGQPRTMQAIAQLAAMLRYSLGQNTEEEGVSLRQELEFTEQYLALEALRFGDRLRVRREIAPAALLCRLPPLTLQPLVENAIRHGFEPRAAPGTLTLRATVLKGVLHLDIQDDGIGSDPAMIATAQGLGLRTVRQRLELFSQGSAAFQVQSVPGCGCTVSLSIPQELRESERPLEAEQGMALR